MNPQRIQMRRTAGWRKPEGAVYVGRPGPYGNPFRIDGSWIMWTAIAIGHRADKAGRQAAAVALHRAWMTGGSIRLREYAPIENREFYTGGALEFGDGSVVSMADQVAGIATYGLSMYPPPTLPPRPDLEPLRGRDLACWCPLDGHPCHADTLLELANAPLVSAEGAGRAL